jgi:general secretion pathway protein F
MEWFFVSWPTLILLGLGIRMALRLHYGARGPEPGDLVNDLLTVCSWVMITLGLVPAILGGLLMIVPSFIVIMAAATLIEAVTQRRAAQRRSICTLLAMLIERKQQLDASTLLAGQTMRGMVGRSAQRLFAALNAGTPLVQAVKENPRALPREAVTYLAAGTSIHAKASALRALSQADHSELVTTWRSCIDRLVYLICVMTFMVAVLLFVMIKIVPEYVSIFSEFGLDLPPITQLSVSFSRFFINYIAVPAIWLLLLLILTAKIVGVCYLCDVHVFRGLADRLFRGRRTADVLRILAVATDERQPLPEVLYRVAQVYPSPTIRRQLLPATSAVSAGEAWQDALRRARIISDAEQALLTAAERAGNLSWALQQIAKRRERRAVLRLAGAVQVAYPIAILSLGLFVGFYAVSLFIPIVKMIHGLAQ